MAAILPMRFRILHLISENAGVSEPDLMKKLEKEYKGEGQLRISIVKEHLTSMRAVGLIEDSSIELDGQSNLKQHVKITEYGKSRLSYLPKSWTPPA